MGTIEERSSKIASGCTIAYFSEICSSTQNVGPSRTFCYMWHVSFVGGTCCEAQNGSIIAVVVVLRPLTIGNMAAQCEKDGMNKRNKAN